MSVVRLGAVSYLNTKPLVYGLDERPDLFAMRFDVPARCAALLHEGRTDLGLIPAIEYLRGDYRLVPGIAIGSDGPVASVALTRILCARHWQIAPKLTPSEPDVRAMLSRADAALIIGDPALTIDAEAMGLMKIDLGRAWKDMTGLPFVYAAWTGRDGACGPEHVAELNAARRRGEAHLAGIAAVESRGDRTLEQQVFRYLSDNLRYGLGDAEVAGLRRFHELAAEQALVPGLRDLRFF